MPSDKNRSAELDDIDQRLIDLLMLDGRMTNRALAEEVGLTDATVAVRVRRMVEHRILSVGPQFDWYVAGFRSQAVAYVGVKGSSPRRVGTKLAALRGVGLIDVTYGDADLVALLLAKDSREMHALATEITGMPGVATLRVDRIADVFCYTRNFSTLPFEPFPLDDLPNPPYEFDEVDRQIIECLRIDGRLSSREIARQNGVSDATVRSRRRRMEDVGLLRVGALVHPFATGRATALAHVGFEVTDNFDDVVEELLKLPATTFCASTTGIRNLVGGFVVPTQEELVTLVSRTLWELDGVKSVRTWPVVRVLAHHSDLVRLV